MSDAPKWIVSCVRATMDRQKWLRVVTVPAGQELEREVAFVPFGDRTTEEYALCMSEAALIASAPSTAKERDELKAENAKLRESGLLLLAMVDEFHAFCADPKRPCGDCDQECPVGMGEWVSKTDIEFVKTARAALTETTETGA